MSVRPPHSNRRAFMHLQRRTFGDHDGCTKGPVPPSCISLRMTTDEGFAAVLYTVGPASSRAVLNCLKKNH